MGFEGGPGPQPCKFKTLKECGENYANWQAANHVRLAQRVVNEGRAGDYRKGKEVFAQTVRVLAGEQATIVAGDGEESRNSFTKRIIAAIEALQSTS